MNKGTNLKDLHAAGARVHAAQKKLESYVAVQRRRDPTGFEAARRAYETAQREYKDQLAEMLLASGFRLAQRGHTQQH